MKGVLRMGWKRGSQRAEALTIDRAATQRPGDLSLLTPAATISIWRRRRGAILLVLLCFSAFTNPAADPANAEHAGHALVQELLAQRPANNTTNTGVLRIRDRTGKRTEIPVTLVTLITATQWQNSYVTTPATNREAASLTVVHRDGQANQYLTQSNSPSSMTAFAASDFWLADLGLEFLHWPRQRLLKKELRRGESCNVLESTHPQPTPGAYARVVSWIDIDTGGILHADAYGPDQKLLKVFEPKKFTKIDGRWQLREMEIRNEQTDSRTTLIFDLDVN